MCLSNHTSNVISVTPSIPSASTENDDDTFTSLPLILGAIGGGVILVLMAFAVAEGCSLLKKRNAKYRERDRQTQYGEQGEEGDDIEERVGAEVEIGEKYLSNRRQNALYYKTHPLIFIKMYLGV